MKAKELVDFIMNGRKAASIVNVRAEVSANAYAPYHNIKKLVTVRAVINFKYTLSVRRKTGNTNFVAAPRAWGVHYKGHPAIIEHKGKFYLQMQPLPEKERVHYYFNPETGEKVDKSVLNFKPEKDSPVMVRAFSIENIRKISIFGQHHEIL